MFKHCWAVKESWKYVFGVLESSGIYLSKRVETLVEDELMLRKLRHTAAGCHGIPAWLLHTCSYMLTEVVAHIIICSIVTGKVPGHWLNALVTPDLKVPKPTRPVFFQITYLYLICYTPR